MCRNTYTSAQSQKCTFIDLHRDAKTTNMKPLDWLSIGLGRCEPSIFLMNVNKGLE